MQQHRTYKFFNFRFLHSPYFHSRKPVDRNEEQCRNGRNTKHLRQFRFLVNIHFIYIQFPLISLCQRLEDWCCGLARSAPRCIEINDSRTLTEKSPLRIFLIIHYLGLKGFRRQTDNWSVLLQSIFGETSRLCTVHFGRSDGIRACHQPTDQKGHNYYNTIFPHCAIVVTAYKTNENKLFYPRFSALFEILSYLCINSPRQ